MKKHCDWDEKEIVRGWCGENGEKRGSACKRWPKSLTFTEGRLRLGFTHYPT